MVKIDCEQGSEAWFTVKLARFSGTRFVKLLAGRNSITYKKLIKEIAAEFISDEMDDTYRSEIMKAANKLEPIARREYERIRGVNVEQVGFCLPGNEKLAMWAGISPDGLLDEDGMLEIKCPLFKTHLQYIDDNVLPKDYVCQVQGQLLITGRKWCDFMSYCKGKKPFIIRVYPDKEMHSELNRALWHGIEDVKETIKMYNEYDFMRACA